MHARQDLMRICGLSYSQLRKRLDSLARADHLLAGQVSKGPNNRLEYSPAVVEMLRELDTLAGKPNKDLEQAAEELADTIHNGREDEPLVKPQSNRDNPTSNPEALQVEVRYLKQTVQELRSERDQWRRLALELKEQIALPSPSRSLWSRLWPWARKPRSAPDNY